jgi:hypothetical protein
MTPEEIAAILTQIAASIAELQVIVAKILHQIGNGH